MGIIKGTRGSTHTVITWTSNQSQPIKMAAHNALRIWTNGSSNATHTLSLRGGVTTGSSDYRKMYQPNSTKLVSVAVSTGGGVFTYNVGMPVVKIVRSSSLLGTTGKFQKVVL